MKPKLVFKKNGCFPVDSFPFFIHKRKQGELSFHRHEFLELVYVWQGRATHYINKNRRVIRQGDAFFISLNDDHRYQQTETLEIINILFLPIFLGRQIFNRKELKPLFDFAFLAPLFGKSSRYLHLTGMADVKARNLIEDMIGEFQKKGAGFQEIIKNDLVNLLIILGRTYQDDQSQIDGLKEQVLRQRRRFEEALRYIEENYTRQVSLSEVSAIACFTPNYFSEIFHKVTGKPFTAYMNDLKMQHAALLLKKTALKVHEIIRQCGFSEYRHFARIFKKTFQLSPSDYRKKVH